MAKSSGHSSKRTRTTVTGRWIAPSKGGYVVDPSTRVAARAQQPPVNMPASATTARKDKS